MKIRKIFILISIFSSSAFAEDINSKLENLFLHSTQYNNATTYRRAGYVGVDVGGGSLRYEQIEPFNLVGFQKTSMNIGCGGIDLHLGSLSFAGDQMIQALKSIIANAVALAFKQAMSSTVPTLANIMNLIEEQINKLNMFNKNSCEIAQGIVTNPSGTAKQVADILNVATNETVSAGVSQDYKDGKDNNTPLNQLPTEKQDNIKKMAGNITKKVVVDQMDLNQNDLEFFISMFGATIITLNEQADKSDDKVKVVDLPPSVDFMPEGALKNLVGSIGSKTGETIQMYRCNNSDCDEPTLSSVVIEETLYTKYRKIIIGGTDTTEESIFKKIAKQRAGDTFTDQQKVIMDYIPLLDKLQTVALKGGDVGINEIATILAVAMQPMIEEIVYQRFIDYGQEFVKAISQAQFQANTLVSPQTLNDMAKKTQDIMSNYQNQLEITRKAKAEAIVQMKIILSK